MPESLNWLTREEIMALASVVLPKLLDDSAWFHHRPVAPCRSP